MSGSTVCLYVYDVTVTTFLMIHIIYCSKLYSHFPMICTILSRYLKLLCKCSKVLTARIIFELFQVQLRDWIYQVVFGCPGSLTIDLAQAG